MLVNPSPDVFTAASRRTRGADERAAEDDDTHVDEIDALEVYEHIRRIRDPEHPHTLEQLRVVDESLITVDWPRRVVRVSFTPTVPHCSLTTLIGLSIYLQLQRSLPQYTKIDVVVTPGSHDQEEQVNKQLGDKERVAAALENVNLLSMVESCIYDSEQHY